MLSHVRIQSTNSWSPCIKTNKYILNLSSQSPGTAPRTEKFAFRNLNVEYLRSCKKMLSMSDSDRMSLGPAATTHNTKVKTEIWHQPSK